MTANDVALAARVVVALVLVVSGVGKLLALRQSSARGVALLLPLCELVLAGLLLFVDATWPSWLALVTFAAFTVVLVRRVVIDDRRPCNCFGAASRGRELSGESLFRNTWFLVLALIATGATTMQAPSAVFATLLLGLGFAVVSVALVVRT